MEDSNISLSARFILMVKDAGNVGARSFGVDMALTAAAAVLVGAEFRRYLGLVWNLGVVAVTSLL